MELDELKGAWQELSERTDSISAEVVTLRQEAQWKGVRARLSRFRGTPVYELVMGFLAALLIGNFLASAPHAVRFVLPALLLHIVAILTIIGSIWQLAMLASIDPAAPIVATQAKLARVRVLRLRTTHWLIVISPALWIPLLIVGSEGLFGFDVYRGFSEAWIVSNVLFGLAMIPILLWVARVMHTRFKGSRFVSQLLDDVAGRNLVAAMRDLDEVRSFGREA
jgi:hypothetical protein